MFPELDGLVGYTNAHRISLGDRCLTCSKPARSHTVGHRKAFPVSEELPPLYVQAISIIPLSEELRRWLSATALWFMTRVADCDLTMGSKANLRSGLGPSADILPPTIAPV